MKVTAYCACAKCTGWTRTCWNCFLFPVYAYGPNKGKRKAVGITSDGTRASHGTIAADLKYYPYKTEMKIPGYGTGVVHDIGSAIKGSRHIDVFFSDHDDALAWGVRHLTVTVKYP